MRHQHVDRRVAGELSSVLARMIRSSLMTGSRRTSLARGGPGRSVAPRTARLSWSPSVARLGQPFMLWNVVHHCEHRALVRDELAVRIPISEAAAGLPVVVAALVVVELDRISRSQRRMISRPMRSTSSPGPLSRKPSAGFACATCHISGCFSLSPCSTSLSSIRQATSCVVIGLDPRRVEPCNNIASRPPAVTIAEA